MALVLLDSFDHYTLADATYKWSTYSGGVTIGSGTGRRSTNSAVIQSGGIAYGTGLQSRYVCGFAIKIPEVENLGNGMIWSGLVSGENLYQLRVSVGNDGSISVIQGTYGGFMYFGTGSTGGGYFKFDAWNYMEIKVDLSSPNGLLEIRLNGVVVYHYEGECAPSRVSYGRVRFIDGFQLMSESWLGAQVYFDDLYMLNWDEAYNNDYLGDVRVDPIYPNNEGSSLEWEPSSGSIHYSLVNEHTPNISDYVYSDVQGDKDMYQFDDLGVPPNSVIYGVQLLNLARKADDGHRLVRNVVRYNSNEEESIDFGLTKEQFKYVRTTHDRDPAGVQWTVASVDAIEGGLVISD